LDEIKIGIIGHSNTGLSSLLKQISELNNTSCDDLKSIEHQELIMKIKKISNTEDISKYENLTISELNYILKFLLLGIDIETAYEYRLMPNEIVYNTTWEEVLERLKLLNSIEEIGNYEPKNSKKQKNWKKERFYK
jgi:hypothetical protein